MNLNLKCFLGAHEPSLLLLHVMDREPAKSDVSDVFSVGCFGPLG